MDIMIGENIKRLRRSKDMTQEQLAEAMNVTCAAVSKWERSETYPDITVLAPLAYHFGVTIDELMGYDESKVRKEIDDLLLRYRKLCTPETWSDAHELINEAYRKYPNDHRIMHWYMWDLAGGSADNDASKLIEHKEAFTEICNKILLGCTDITIRFEAYSMLGKLLWAEGRSDEALALYRENMTDWYASVGQKSEQLFAKDTPEFLYWVRRNMYQLVGFAADKLSKSVFFNSSIPYAERVEKIENYGDRMMETYRETDEDFFLVFAASVMVRLANDLKYRGGTAADIARVSEKASHLRRVVAERQKVNEPLRDIKD